MCRPTTGTTTAESTTKGENDSEKYEPLLLLSLKSYTLVNTGLGRVSLRSTIVTGMLVIAVLTMVEMSLRQLFFSLRHHHEVLDNEINRQILARHIGVDTFSCLIVAYIGWSVRNTVHKDFYDLIFGRRKSLPYECEGRFAVYHPEAARLLVFFLAYQVKNTYDSIVWDDGIVFLIHHALTIASVTGALSMGCAHYYGLYFVGTSEFSTAILCLLANYDDKNGVQGLSEAFPLGKVILGAVFATSFIVFRVILWSTLTYYFFQDAKRVRTSKDPKVLVPGRMWFYKFGSFTLGCLSVLQIIWLGEIFHTAYVELKAMGYI